MADRRAPNFWPRRTAPPSGERHAPIEVGRLHAFTDGVFAIAATLLVLELRVPELAERLSGAAQERALLRGLGALWPQFLAFGLSFVLIGRMWVLHSRFTWGLRRADAGLGQLNLLYLLTISLLPFSSALLGAHGNLRVSWWVYCLNLVLMEVCFLRLLTYAARHGNPSATTHAQWLGTRAQALAALLVFVLAALIAAWNVTAGELSTLLLIPAGALAHARRAPTPPDAAPDEDAPEAPAAR